MYASYDENQNIYCIKIYILHRTHFEYISFSTYSKAQSVVQRPLHDGPKMLHVWWIIQLCNLKG